MAQVSAESSHWLHLVCHRVPGPPDPHPERAGEEDTAPELRVPAGGQAGHAGRRGRRRPRGHPAQHALRHRGDPDGVTEFELIIAVAV